MKRFSLRRRRGLTLFEMMIASLILIWILAVLAAFASVNSNLWRRGMLDSSSQADAQKAIQTMAPHIRAARRVDEANSSATVLTLQLPKYDASGDLVIPMADGDVVQYYLSDSTGNQGVAGGSILWRTINGVKDTTWAMSGSEPQIRLAAGGLTFTYFPVINPETVTVAVTSTITSGTATRSFVTSQEVMLRNHGL